MNRLNGEKKPLSVGVNKTRELRLGGHPNALPLDVVATQNGIQRSVPLGKNDEKE